MSASSPTAGASAGEEAALSGHGVGDENLLDDLLTQNHDHETMFEEEEDETHKRHDEDDDEENLLKSDDETDEGRARGERSGGDNPALNDNHSDISDAESEHDDANGEQNAKANDSFDPQVKGAEDISDKSDEEAPEEEVTKPAASKSRRERKSSSPAAPPRHSREKIRPPPDIGKRSVAKAVKEEGVEEKHGRAQASAAAPAAAKKKGKSYDYATKLNYLFRDARFFLVKSNNAENVALSKAKGVWSTPPANEARLNQAFEEARNVLLIFSVKESGKFAGLARLATESRRDGPPIPWNLPPGLSAKGAERKACGICSLGS